MQEKNNFLGIFFIIVSLLNGYGTIFFLGKVIENFNFLFASMAGTAIAGTGVLLQLTFAILIYGAIFGGENEGSK